MIFRFWFKEWVNSIFKLLTVNLKKYKSDARRKKERERRLKAMHSNKRFYWAKKKPRRRRRSSYTVQSQRTIYAILMFTATSLGVLLLPLGLLNWGRKNAKEKKASKKSTTQKNASPKSQAKASSKQTDEKARKVVTDTSKENTAFLSSCLATSALETEAVTEPEQTAGTVPHELSASVDSKEAALSLQKPPVAEVDENTPKSKPKNEEDRYIRKRMIIAGSSFSNKEVLSRLEIGSYLEIESEPDNPFDKDAVMLLYGRQKVGYISKRDKLPYVTCLGLGRKVYGVITDIVDDKPSAKYEFETWFEKG